ncbi:MAG: T9SS type A sorting domain-containing protein [Bacteroidales bacterium]|nr:T9SS type A sorting domain-containing protein [Bacteroidales bacterium]
MRKKLTYIVFAFALFFANNLFAQETLSGLQTNPEIKGLHQTRLNQKNTTKSKASISLPFIDDFAKSVGLPDSSLWLDDMAFINVSYADSVPSIGVATLDAINSLGLIHENASSLPFSADTLTSKQINLNYPNDNTIFLSFYYEPGGLGDSPDPKDTLILEYYSIDSTRWDKVWYVNFNETDSMLIENNVLESITDTIYGDTITNLKHKFQQVLIPVNHNQYRKDNFQFRFRNYASLSSTESNESRASNSDHWHIDFIILNKDRSIIDTAINDISIIEPITSLFKSYEAIPYRHYPSVMNTEIKETYSILNRNLGNSTPNPVRKFVIYNLSGLGEPEEFGEGELNDMTAFSTQKYTTPLYYAFPFIPNIDSISFEIQGITDANLTTSEPEEYKWNDTTRFIQKLYNYYAYDDGTSENGYGLIGEGTEKAMVAMRFNSFEEDTLTGIQIYFNQTLKNANQIDYKIHVWDELNGIPNSIIYTLDGLDTTNTNNLNEFIIIPFEEKKLISGTFYIGWQKEYSREMLNVGFDVNRINNDKLFYNYSGEWKQSQYEGTVMIRPMFGRKVEVITGQDKKPTLEKLEFNIYPNPAQDKLNIDLNNNFEMYTYSIFDSYGRIVSNKSTYESSIDISNITPGIYFIRITNSDNATTTKKFIIIR